MRRSSGRPRISDKRASPHPNVSWAETASRCGQPNRVAQHSLSLSTIPTLRRRLLRYTKPPPKPIIPSRRRCPAPGKGSSGRAGWRRCGTPPSSPSPSPPSQSPDPTPLLPPRRRRLLLRPPIPPNPARSSRNLQKLHSPDPYCRRRLHCPGRAGGAEAHQDAVHEGTETGSS